MPSEPQPPAANPPTADDVCRTLEEAAAENGLPVEFFARVIWQESRFNAQAVSPKGASGIAQFMPRAASWHGPIRSIRLSGAAPFGGLSARTARPVWQSRARCRPRKPAWLAKSITPCRTRRATTWQSSLVPWTADEWASGSPPQTADTKIFRRAYPNPARQSHLGSEGGGETDRGLHTALGNMACSPSGPLQTKARSASPYLIGDLEPIVQRDDCQAWAGRCATSLPSPMMIVGCFISLRLENECYRYRLRRDATQNWTGLLSFVRLLLKPQNNYAPQWSMARPRRSRGQAG